MGKLLKRFDMEWHKDIESPDISFFLMDILPPFIGVDIRGQRFDVYKKSLG